MHEKRSMPLVVIAMVKNKVGLKELGMLREWGSPFHTSEELSERGM